MSNNTLSSAISSLRNETVESSITPGRLGAILAALHDVSQDCTAEAQAIIAEFTESFEGVLHFAGFASAAAQVRQQGCLADGAEMVYHPGVNCFVARREGNLYSSVPGGERYGEPTFNGYRPLSKLIYVCDADRSVYLYNGTALVLLAAGITVYRSGETYTRGQVVSRNNALYLVTATSTTTAPGPSSAGYETILTAPTASEYISLSNAVQGMDDRVRDLDADMTTAKQNISTAADNIDDLSSSISDLWQAQPQPYVPGRTYYEDSIVSHNNVLYRVTTATNTTPSPDNGNYTVLVDGADAEAKVDTMRRDLAQYAQGSPIALTVAQTNKAVDVSGNVVNKSGYKMSALVTMKKGYIYLIRAAEPIAADVALCARYASEDTDVVIEYSYTYDGEGNPLTATADYDSSLVYTFDSEGNITDREGNAVDALPGIRTVERGSYIPLFRNLSNDIPSSGYYAVLANEDMKAVWSAPELVEIIPVSYGFLRSIVNQKEDKAVVKKLQERMTDAEENIEDVQKTLPPKRKVFEDYPGFYGLASATKQINDEWVIESAFTIRCYYNQFAAEKNSIIRIHLTNNNTTARTVHIAQFTSNNIGATAVDGCEKVTLTLPANGTLDYDYFCAVDGFVVVGSLGNIIGTAITSQKYPCLMLGATLESRMIMTPKISPRYIAGGNTVSPSGDVTGSGNSTSAVYAYDLREYIGRKVLVSGSFVYSGASNSPYILSSAYPANSGVVLPSIARATNDSNNYYNTAIVEVTADYPWLFVNGERSEPECRLIATDEEVSLKNAERSDDEQHDRERIDLLKIMAPAGYTYLLRAGATYNGSVLKRDTWIHNSALTNKVDIIKIGQIATNFTQFNELSNLETFEALEGSSIAHLTSLGLMFYYCFNLRRVDLSSWDMEGKSCGANWLLRAHLLEYIMLSPKFFKTTSDITFQGLHLGKNANFEDNGWLAHLADVAPIIRNKAGYTSLLEEENGQWYLNDGVGRTITLHANIKNAAWASQYITILTNKGYTVA